VAVLVTDRQASFWRTVYKQAVTLRTSNKRFIALSDQTAKIVKGPRTARQITTTTSPTALCRRPKISLISTPIFSPKVPVEYVVPTRNLTLARKAGPSRITALPSCQSGMKKEESKSPSLGGIWPSPDLQFAICNERPLPQPGLLLTREASSIGSTIPNGVVIALQGICPRPRDNYQPKVPIDLLQKAVDSRAIAPYSVGSRPTRRTTRSPAVGCHPRIRREYGGRALFFMLDPAG